MSDHYYTEQPVSGHDEQAFSLLWAGRTLRFTTDAGVFSKGHLDKGTALLLSALPEMFSGRALDMGCGWGAVGVCMAARWPDAQVVMSDINQRAVSLAKRNLAENALSATVVQGDGFAHIDGSFDLIAINPPIRAGKQVVLDLIAGCVDRLRPQGRLYVVMRKQQGAESAQKHLVSLAADVQIVARGGGFRVFCAQKVEAQRENGYEA